MAPPFQQTTVYRHIHSSPPSHNASVYLSLLVVAMFLAHKGIPWVLTYISQMFWTLFLKKRMAIFIAVVIVFLVYCAFLSKDDDNNNESTNSCYNELQASSYWVPIWYQLQEEREEDNLQLVNSIPTIKEPRRLISGVRNLQLPHSSPPPQLPVIQQGDQESDGNKEKKKKIQKRVKNLDTIRNPQTPSTLKPPLPKKANRSNRRFYNVSLGSPISSPSPQQATAQKPVSPVNSSSFSSEYEKMSSSSNSSPFNLPPPIPPFKISQWKWKVVGDVAILRSNSSSSGDSPIPKLYFSSDVDAKAERFIESFNADLEKQRRGRSNRARLRTGRKK